jgi:hypothetical protein
MGMAIDKESIEASMKAHGDFVFMEDSPGLSLVISRIRRMYCCYWRACLLSIQTAKPLA